MGDSVTRGTNGQTVGFWVCNTTMFTSIICVATFKMMLETRTWTNWSILAFVLSLFLWLLVYAAMPLDAGFANQDIFGVPATMTATPQFWFIIIAATILCLAPEILYKYVRRMYLPSRLNVIEELESYKGKRKQFISEILSFQQKEKEILDNKHDEDAAARHKSQSNRSHLGFSEFAVGKDSPHYVMSQQRYMKLAMKKPRFSHLKKILKKKKNSEQNKTSSSRE